MRNFLPKVAVFRIRSTKLAKRRWFVSFLLPLLRFLLRIRTFILRLEIGVMQWRLHKEKRPQKALPERSELMSLAIEEFITEELPLKTNPSRLMRWEQARLFAKRFRQVDDLDAFAREYYLRFPDCPPDPFDQIVWNSPEKQRLYNRSGAKWKRANAAVGPNGIMTRLFDQLAIPTFASPSLTDIGFTSKDSSYKNYQDKVLITEVKEAVKERVRGSAWLSIEVGREKGIHPHVLGEHDAFDFNAFTELIYEPKELFRYLIKGIPFTPENLAVYWKAKRALPKGKQLVRKTVTIRLPYSKN